jgi:hypothetical protein
MGSDGPLLAPSEVLYLEAILVASHYSEERVSELFAVAILANGDAGLMRLEEVPVENPGRFLGGKELHLIAEGKENAWPETSWTSPCLELQMLTLVRQWPGHRRLRDLVADFLPRNPPVPFNPHQSLLALIEGWTRSKSLITGGRGGRIRAARTPSRESIREARDFLYGEPSITAKPDNLLRLIRRIIGAHTRTEQTYAP